ncbi:MAG: hypothetical protein J2P48_12620 [Alphaproteobacteria bacterium]|nr:hypothetical protein [Alphaproteobacteria bacterium]
MFVRREQSRFRRIALSAAALATVAVAGVVTGRAAAAQYYYPAAYAAYPYYPYSPYSYSLPSGGWWGGGRHHGWALGHRGWAHGGWNHAGWGGHGGHS